MRGLQNWSQLPKATKSMTLLCSESCHGLHVRQRKSQSPDNSPEGPPQSGPHDLPDFIHSHSPCHPLPLGHTGFLALPRKYSHFWTFALAVTTACNTPFPQYLLCALLHFLESLLKYHLLSSLTTLSIPPTTLALFIPLPCFLSLHPICYFYWFFFVCANRCYWLPVNPPSWILHEAREFVCLDYCCVPSV